MTFGSEIPGGRICGVSSYHYLPPKKVHVDYMQQDSGAIDGWTTFTQIEWIYNSWN